MQQNQVPVLSIKLTKPGVELVLNSLAQLPYIQTAGLIREIEAQANTQLSMYAEAAQAADKVAATQPLVDPEKQPDGNRGEPQEASHGGTD